MANSKEISSRGIAQRSGWDVFSSIITYNGEYLNWGSPIAYGVQLGSDTDYATTAADPHTDALINSPASDIGRWYRYHTSGAPYTSTSAPTSSSSAFTETSSSSITFPVSNTSTSINTSTFTAETANDIIQIYFTTEETSSIRVSISSISIKEKQEYLVPIYANDAFNNDHKVLRRKANQTIYDD